jgi:electron transfer flavoprotein alpha subunit
MREIFVLAEHRQGQIRDITFEMLSKGMELTEKTNTELTALLFGKDTKNQAKALAEYAKHVLTVDDAKLENFNSDAYQTVLSHLMKEHKPLLTMIGHTSFGVDLAPSLAASLNAPLATDCIGLEYQNDTLTVTRQMYGGKVNAKAMLSKADSYIVTVRQATFPIQKETHVNGEIIEVPSPLAEEITAKRFIEYVPPPPGGVDITAAEVLISIGRGIKDVCNIPLVEELAKVLGGTLACSRPIVDKGWLPNDRQVGTSGKTVKPKLYIALGISGAFQHMLGMKSSGLIISVNKDPNAPIFSVADYGVVDDLFKIVPSLKNKVYELKGQKAKV